MQVNGTQKIFGLSLMRALAAFAALLGIVGIFLPWLTYNIPGYASGAYSVGSNNVYTGLLSIIALVIIFSDKLVAIVAQSSPSNSAGGSSSANQLSSVNGLIKGWSNVILLILGAMIVLLAWSNMNDINRVNDLWHAYSLSGNIAGVGIGLWLTIIGGALMVISVVLSLVLYRERLVPSMPAMGPAPAPAPYMPPMQPQSAPYAPANIPVAPAQNKFCPSCGAPLTGNAFCGVCGNKVQ